MMQNPIYSTTKESDGIWMSRNDHWSFLELNVLHLAKNANYSRLTDLLKQRSAQSGHPAAQVCLWRGSGCSWYFLNDPSCEFADQKTVSAIFKALVNSSESHFWLLHLMRRWTSTCRIVRRLFRICHSGGVSFRWIMWTNGSVPSKLIFGGTCFGWDDLRFHWIRILLERAL